MKEDVDGVDPLGSGEVVSIEEGPNENKLVAIDFEISWIELEATAVAEEVVNRLVEGSPAIHLKKWILCINILCFKWFFPLGVVKWLIFRNKVVQ